MPTDYDALYADTPHALGEPSRELVKLFTSHLKPGSRVLDLGCGQGRDALHLARAGHSVLGVDNAARGIEAMLAEAEPGDLRVQGMVADLTTFETDERFDLVLLDRVLHMLPVAKRVDAFVKCLGFVDANGCVLVADERKNIAVFSGVLGAQGQAWALAVDKPTLLLARRT